MDSFDLGRLTGVDFEAVCADLLGELLGARLELFAPGKDQGIDLRHVPTLAGGPTIVQCKHWPDAAPAEVASRLVREELPKVRALKPGRYIIATSARLSVDAKQKILGAFYPHLRDTGDILGREELVEELRKRPHLVQRHFRLWLSSTHVLQTVLNQDIFVRSSWLKRRISTAADTFVQHDAFTRARGLLESHHVCLISGIPGSGKTTIALMLGAYLAGEGYELYEISSDAREASAVWVDGVKQAFLYDDFLGSTALISHLSKNEDARLTTLLEQISASPGKALIMTTRGYILEQARQRHGRLGAAAFRTVTDAIELADFTVRTRAQIVYNHACGADLERRRGFADPTAWTPIVGHRNFNPRVIAETVRLVRDGDLATAVLANLDKPEEIWEHIVDHELSDEAVDVLDVLFTLYRPTVKELQDAWLAYRASLDLAGDARAFRHAMQILEGTMIVVETEHDLFEYYRHVADNADEVLGSANRSVQKVAFHNPSIADYVRSHFAARHTRLTQVIPALNQGQLRRLLDAVQSPLRGEDHLLGLLRDAHAEIAAAVRAMEESIEEPVSDEDESLAQHLEWALQAAERLGSSALATYVTEKTDATLVRSSPYSHLAPLADALSRSSLIQYDHCAQFRDSVGQEITWHLQDMLEGEHWSYALTAYGYLTDLADYEIAPITDEMVQGGLRQLREYTPEKLTDSDLDAVTELLDFLTTHHPGFDSDPEFLDIREAVRTLDEHRRAEHAAQQKAPTVHATASRASDTQADDRQFAAQLMRHLAQP